MTRQNRTISPRIRRAVMERDNFKCIKCGHKVQELHHIVPAYKGGVEEEWNLISLCHSCHKEAPDEPLDFFKWAATSLPPRMDECLKLTKICIGIMSYNKEIIEELNKLKDYSNKECTRFEENKVFTWIESFYKDLWKVYISNDLKNLTVFFEDYFPSSKESRLKDKQSTIQTDTSTMEQQSDGCSLS